MLHSRLKIIDFHAHFPVRSETGRNLLTQEYIDKYGEEKWKRVKEWLEADQRAWRLRWAFPDPEPPGSDEDVAARWASESERYGLVRVVFLTGGGNERLARVVRLHPDKFIGFAHHDPFASNAAEELERAVLDLGLRGYKIIAPLLKDPLDDERLWPLWELAERLGIPVLIHFGILRYQGIVNHPNINPLILQNVARAFPGIPFVIPHFGCGYPKELLHLAWVCGNVYVDTSGSNEWVRWMPYELDLKTLFRRFLETVGPDRILFGSDSSWFPRGFAVRYLEEQLRICGELGLEDESLERIFGGNAARLLKISLEDRPIGPRGHDLP